MSSAVSKTLLVCLALALSVGSALADQTVFLNYTDAMCPSGDNGPMTGYWFNAGACISGAFSTWAPPAGFTCLSTTQVWHITSKDGCITYVEYWTDNDSRTMNNTCTTFTSPQTTYSR